MSPPIKKATIADLIQAAELVSAIDNCSSPVSYNSHQSCNSQNSHDFSTVNSNQLQNHSYSYSYSQEKCRNHNNQNNYHFFDNPDCASDNFESINLSVF